MADNTKESRSLTAREQNIARENKQKQLLEFIGLKTTDYAYLSFSKEEIVNLRKYMSHLTTGAVATIPLKCCGGVCPFKDQCPLFEMKKLPIGKPCFLETQLLMNWRRTYVLEYDIDPENFTELGLINDLAEIELLQWRLNNNLAKAEFANLLQDETVAVDREGNVLSKKTVSPLLDMKEKLSNRKSRIIKSLVGDRQEKYKREAALKIRDVEDQSTSMADLRRTIDKLVAQTRQQLPETTQQREDRENDAIERIEQPQQLTPDDLLSDLLKDDEE